MTRARQERCLRQPRSGCKLRLRRATCEARSASEKSTVRKYTDRGLYLTRLGEASLSPAVAGLKPSRRVKDFFPSLPGSLSATSFPALDVAVASAVAQEVSVAVLAS